MRVKLFLFPLLLCIVPLVLAVLGYLRECLLDRGPHERRGRTRLRRAAGASRGLRWTGLPEPVARRWAGPDFYRNYWETVAALSELVRDDIIRSLSRCSDQEAPMCPRLPPQARQGLLKSRKSGPKCPN